MLTSSLMALRLNQGNGSADLTIRVPTVLDRLRPLALEIELMLPIRQ